MNLAWLRRMLGLSHLGLIAMFWCYTEAEEAQQHPGTKAAINPAEDNCKKQCEPNKIKPNAIPIQTRKRYKNPTHKQTPSRVKSANP